MRVGAQPAPETAIGEITLGWGSGALSFAQAGEQDAGTCQLKNAEVHTPGKKSFISHEGWWPAGWPCDRL